MNRILAAGLIELAEICKGLNVSVATARRDLALLEQQGRIRRNRGGAVPVEPLLYEPFRHVSTFHEQLNRNAAAKRRIAAAAAALVQSGETIALTPGTTTIQITRSLPVNREVKVVTNTANMAMELSNRAGVTVIVTGGFMNAGWFSMVGPLATHAMEQLFADKAFLGCNGLDAAHGLSAYHPDEAAFNAVLAKQAKMRIAVADASKLGVVATHLFCPPEDIDLVITDTGASPEAVAALVQRGIEVRQV